MSSSARGVTSPSSKWRTPTTAKGIPSGFSLREVLAPANSLATSPRRSSRSGLSFLLIMTHIFAVFGYEVNEFISSPSTVFEYCQQDLENMPLTSGKSLAFWPNRTHSPRVGPKRRNK